MEALVVLRNILEKPNFKIIVQTSLQTDVEVQRETSERGNNDFILARLTLASDDQIFGLDAGLLADEFLHMIPARKKNWKGKPKLDY